MNYGDKFYIVLHGKVEEVVFLYPTMHGQCTVAFPRKKSVIRSYINNLCLTAKGAIELHNKHLEDEIETLKKRMIKDATNIRE